MNAKAAIYHFTDESFKRPKIYKSQLNTLENFAFINGFTTFDIYCDMSLKRFERTEFDRLLYNINQYDALFTKDFYHISKNTSKCIEIMKQLTDTGLRLYSIENGAFLLEDAPLTKHLRVATYTSQFGTPDEFKEIINVRNSIFTLFTNKKTNWSILDQYFDKSLYQKDDELIQLKELIKNRNNYDILLVHNLNDIHWRTANFCRIREQLQLDIFSLQEGFLKYRKNI